MFETDADRLAMIKALGGLDCKIRGGCFWGIFDNASADALTLVESTDPVITCRSSDVTHLSMVKDDTIDICGDLWRIKKFEPDGTGITRILLKR